MARLAQSLGIYDARTANRSTPRKSLRLAPRQIRLIDWKESEKRPFPIIPSVLLHCFGGSVVYLSRERELLCGLGCACAVGSPCRLRQLSALVMKRLLQGE